MKKDKENMLKEKVLYISKNGIAKKEGKKDNVLEQSRAEQSRAEQSRAEQSRAEQSRAEQFILMFCV